MHTPRLFLTRRTPIHYLKTSKESQVSSLSQTNCISGEPDIVEEKSFCTEGWYMIIQDEI